jgi:hypothetical protein
MIAELTPLLTGWVAYYKLATVKNTFEHLDEWLRRKLRCVLWRQWKRPRTRAKRLMEQGIDSVLTPLPLMVAVRGGTPAPPI